MIEHNIGKWTMGIFAALLALFVLIGVTTSLVRVDAGEIVVVQNAFGKMTVYSEPGWETCFFGKVTHYQKSFQYSFEQGTAAIPIRFNDGAQGTVAGSVRVDLPLDTESMLAINATFGSQEAVDQQLIRTVIEKSISMTGPLMSSKESYAEKRADLIGDIEDQAAHGVYKTHTIDAVVIDPLTQSQKHTNAVEIVKSDSAPQRQEDSPLARFKVHLYNLTLSKIEYSDAVEAQIKAQQEATMQVQTAIATAKKAEQDALTAAKQGEAAATKAEWEQKTINAKTVAEAEGLALAAEQNKKAAGFNKDAAILDGQGQAEKKRLLTQANGNLDPKLAAWVQANQAYATAIQNCRGNLVPAVIMGGSGASGSGPSNVADFIDMIKVRTAREISLDTSMTNNTSSTPMGAISDAVPQGSPVAKAN